MSAEIIQFIPKPNPNRQRELEKEAAKILVPFVETESFGGTHPLVPFGGQGIDGMDLGPERA